MSGRTAFLRRFLADRKAATAVEYALILALIFLAIVAAVAALGDVTSGMWSNVAAKVDSAVR